MFTGLVTDIGEVVSIERPDNGDMVVHIKTKLAPAHLTLGASVACAGVCLTVVAYNDDVFTVQASSETLSKTKLGAWNTGMKINLEPSLRLGDELGGHLVFGHVDGLADIVAIENSGDSRRITMRAPEALRRFIAVKGSVTLDGTSLTVNALGADTFDLMIIPHTLTHTTLGDQKPGDQLHLEIDMIARYIDRQMEFRT